MRLNPMGGGGAANDSMVNMAGTGSAASYGAGAGAYAMAPSESRASYNTLEMAGEQPMCHAVGGGMGTGAGYYDQGVSFFRALAYADQMS